LKPLLPAFARILALPSPAALCRLDADLVSAMASARAWGKTTAAGLVYALAGSAVFGAAFGCWRAPLQALYSALKMPVLILAVTGFSAVINTLLAQALGAALSFRQVLGCMLTGFAITSILLAAVAPCTLFFAWQAPPPDSSAALLSYRVLLPLNTAVVGVCGILANLRLFRLLATLTGSSRLAARVLIAWILASGLAGCELSWVLSPFLARPDLPIPFFNPNALTGNFFEYLFKAAFGVLEGQ